LTGRASGAARGRNGKIKRLAMTYRKFKADYLWLGDRMAGPGSILITTPEGVVQSVVPEAEAGEGVEQLDGLLCPGFVNCHCHLELSHLKGSIREGTGLVDFLLGVIGLRGQYSPEQRAEAMAAAEEEMLGNGVVAVGDICNTIETLDRKRAGRLKYRNFIETMGFIEKTAPERFQAGLQVYQAFEQVSKGSNSIVPHAPYSVGPALFRLIARFAGGDLLTIHSQETAAENDFYLNGQGDLLRLYQGLGLDVSWFRGNGKRSLEGVLGYFHRGQPLILVHNVATEAIDLDAAEDWESLYYCLCPNANRYISGILPDMKMLTGKGVRLVIGTDSLASNRQLNILEELKTLQRSFPWLETPALLEWATANGAAALQMDAGFGRFVPGFRPGVLLLNGLDKDRLTAETTVKRVV
jgi:cytosine/adenosine deaminase-related metal-dependent hydrolase